MYRYVKAASPIKGLMGKLGGMLKGMLTDAISDAFTDKPKSSRVKDPDTGAIGNLYTYQGKKNGASLNVEMYPFAGLEVGYIVRCYLTKNNKVLEDTITIVNKMKGKAIEPITSKNVKQEIAAYCEMYKDKLGVRKMKEAQQEITDDLDNQEDDGFEPADTDDESEE